MHATRELDEDLETVTSDTFSSVVLMGHGPIAVEFMSYGCAHCRALEPVVQHAARRLSGAERIVRVNVGIDQELANTYDVRGTPTPVMFLDGRIVGRVEGPHPSLDRVMAALTAPFAS